MYVDFLLSLFLLILFFFSKKIATVFNLLDKPTSIKKHKIEIPVIGGIFIWIIISIKLAIDFFNYNNLYSPSNSIFNIYLLSTFFLIVGVIDDKTNLNSILRLILLAIATFIFFNFKFLIPIEILRINEFGELNLVLSSIFITVLCLILYQNAMNMIDGINGSAALSFILLCIYIYLKNNTLDSSIIVLILLSLIIFLIFNLKSLVFLGDGGIYFISSFIGLYLIQISQMQKNIYADEIFLLMILPGVDMLRLFILRIRDKKNPFNGDRNHFHHILTNIYNDKTSLFLILFFQIFPLILKFYFNISSYLIILLWVLVFLSFIFFLKKKNKKKI